MSQWFPTGAVEENYGAVNLIWAVKGMVNVVHGAT